MLKQFADNTDHSILMLVQELPILLTKIQFPSLPIITQAKGTELLKTGFVLDTAVLKNLAIKFKKQVSQVMIGNAGCAQHCQAPKLA